MNSKRGFKRITLILAAVAALLCGAISVIEVVERRDWAEYFLEDKVDDLLTDYVDIAEFKSSGWEGPTLNMQEFRRMHPDSHLSDAEVRTKFSGDFKEIQELKSGFWRRLSKSSFVALCVAAGLAGGIAGFSSAWLILWFGGLTIYKLIKWLILGFCDDVNSKQVESMEAR